MSGWDRWREPAEPSWAAEPTHEWRPQFPGQRYPGDIGLEHLTPPAPRGRSAVVGRAEVHPVSPAPGDAYPVSPAGPDDRRGAYPVSPAGPDERRGGYPGDRRGPDEPHPDGRRAWADRRGDRGPVPHPGDRYDQRDQPAAWRDDRHDQRWVRPEPARRMPDGGPHRPVSPAPEPGWLPEPDEYPHRSQARPEQRRGTSDGRSTAAPRGPQDRREPGFDGPVDRREPVLGGWGDRREPAFDGHGDRREPGRDRPMDRREQGFDRPADRREPAFDGRRDRREPDLDRRADRRDPGFDGPLPHERDPRREAAARAEAYREAPDGQRRPVDPWRPEPGRYGDPRPAAHGPDERWDSHRPAGDPTRPRPEEWPVVERRPRTEPAAYRPDERHQPPVAPGRPGPDGRPPRPADEATTRYDGARPETGGPRFDAPRPEVVGPRPEDRYRPEERPGFRPHPEERPTRPAEPGPARPGDGWRPPVEPAARTRPDEPRHRPTPPAPTRPDAGVPVSGVPVSSAPVSGGPVTGPPVSAPPVSGPPVSAPPVSGGPVSGMPAQPQAAPRDRSEPPTAPEAPVSASPAAGLRVDFLPGPTADPEGPAGPAPTPSTEGTNAAHGVGRSPSAHERAAATDRPAEDGHAPARAVAPSAEPDKASVPTPGASSVTPMSGPPAPAADAARQPAAAGPAPAVARPMSAPPAWGPEASAQPSSGSPAPATRPVPGPPAAERPAPTAPPGPAAANRMAPPPVYAPPAPAPTPERPGSGPPASAPTSPAGSVPGPAAAPATGSDRAAPATPSGPEPAAPDLPTAATVRPVPSAPDSAPPGTPASELAGQSSASSSPPAPAPARADERASMPLAETTAPSLQPGSAPPGPVSAPPAQTAPVPARPAPPAENVASPAPAAPVSGPPAPTASVPAQGSASPAESATSPGSAPPAAEPPEPEPEQGERPEVRPADPDPDPEQALATVRWRLHPETLREEAPDPEALREIRDGLTTKLGSALDNRSRARLLSLRAVASRILGDLDDALADARLALTYADATGELRRTALARARLAEVLRWRGEYAEADRLFAEANSPELPDRLRAALHEHAGRCCYDQGRMTEACLHLERALDLRQGDDAELNARTELALDAVAERAATTGFGPKPRDRETILGGERYPVPTLDEERELWGFADAEGNLVVDHRYAEVKPFQEGMAWVRLPEASRWALIDTTGVALIEANNGYRAVGSFSEGLAWVSMDGKGRWMAVDPTNIVKIPPGFEDVRPFRGGLAAVRQNGGWGAVDRSGQVVVPTRYHGLTTALADGRQVDGFTEEGLAGVELAGRRGVVDRTGRVLVAPVYSVLIVHPVAFLVGDDTGRWGARDRRGQPLIDPVHPSRAAVVAEIEQLLTDTSPVL
ncbi:WG repeat-containing protein [Micromonospora sp. NPDC005806]|uniref:WG repeat-containing protein n=1 Tax=Micromonospora sp. NPDC005806 TaxID=3364234 RepID=UPI003686E6AD